MAMAVWAGGMIFLALVLVPIVRLPLASGLAGLLVHHVGLRYRNVGWACLGLLILSGIVNLAYRGYGWGDLIDGRLWQGQFGQLLGGKLLLVATVLVLSAIHDFRIGPRAAVLMREQPDSPKALRARRLASWCGRVNLLLALAIVFLGVMLVRGLPS